MSVSIVLACYNGEKRIVQQLDSLRNQTEHIDEVLIVDDCSTDHTEEMIKSYIEKYELSCWTVKSNAYNKGWKISFFEALSEAKGDFIFLCDQDDKWKHDKIEKMIKAAESNSRIGVLACDYDVAYDAGAIRLRKYKKHREEKKERISPSLFTTRFFQNPSPGCTYLVRKVFFDMVKSYWFPEAPHDEFLWLMATMQDNAWFLNEKLMRMNRYESNASDIRYKDIPLQQKNLNYIETMLGRMQAFSVDFPDKVELRKNHLINQAVIWCRKRQVLMLTRNPLRWIVMFPYWKYYNSFQNCLSDLYLVIFRSFKRI